MWTASPASGGWGGGVAISRYLSDRPRFRDSVNAAGLQCEGSLVTRWGSSKDQSLEFFHFPSCRHSGYAGEEG